MHFGKSAFLISKPLQLIVALCIAQQETFELKPLFVIVDLFNGASDVAARLSSEFTDLQEPKYFATRKMALKFLQEQQCDHLFVDSDVGLKNFLVLALFKTKKPNISINVYEEGLGTYRTDLYFGIKKRLYDLIGIGVFFGACRFVNEVYVFCTEEYSAKIPQYGFKTRKIRGNLTQYLIANRAAFKRIFNFDEIKPSSPEISSCSVYLSSWNVDEDFLYYFNTLDGDLFIKPHPHIRDNLKFERAQSINARVPAELLVLDLIEKYNFVQVYDNNSSARRYINNENIDFKFADAPFNTYINASAK
jgi:hypothetical protein